MKKLKKLTNEQHTSILLGFCSLGFFLILISYLLNRPGAPHFTLWLGILSFALSIVWRIIFIKCPHCGDRLLGSRVTPKFCPSCGKEINPPNEGDTL